MRHDLVVSRYAIPIDLSYIDELLMEFPGFRVSQYGFDSATCSL